MCPGRRIAAMCCLLTARSTEFTSTLPSRLSGYSLESMSEFPLHCLRLQTQRAPGTDNSWAAAWRYVPAASPPLEALRVARGYNRRHEGSAAARLAGSRHRLESVAKSRLVPAHRHDRLADGFRLIAVIRPSGAERSHAHEPGGDARTGKCLARFRAPDGPRLRGSRAARQ